jgi:hypothetical protein
MIKDYKRIKMLSAALCFGIMLFLFCSFHPYYVSVTDIKYKEAEKTLQISCRTFTDNLETALKKIYGKPVDILHPKDKADTEKLLVDYINKHLKIKINGKLQTLTFIGYEKEEEAIWTYLEIKNVVVPKTITIENTLLYEYLSQQINMVHIEVKDKKQSSKVTNPEKDLEFKF